MSAKIFIDGEAGTTGLQIRARLQGRSDVELIGLADNERKDVERRRQMLNGCDLALLCLPDEAAREAVALRENPQSRGIFVASRCSVLRLGSPLLLLSAMEIADLMS